MHLKAKQEVMRHCYDSSFHGTSCGKTVEDALRSKLSSCGLVNESMDVTCDVKGHGCYMLFTIIISARPRIECNL